MYVGGITFLINKSFGRLQLIPESTGLRFFYVPVIEGVDAPDSLGFLDLLVPIDAIGGLWATAKAFLFGVESLDENVILKGNESSEDSDILIKLYRDKPRGAHGKLTGEETSWLRIVTGRSEEERRRVKLGPRDLLCLELACSTVMTLAAEAKTHKPEHV
ncbi:MAG: hypothetical protein GYA55_06600 [SAR324 cluster bacterium]|uniref:Uncharacterized protein n=1 Tax=SAR324 cluster bacterium TaxID=2024889 RepID=A0A7X9FS18_9DELT|nr:hypothetical protein [SAR324 cluster bacterium]